MWVLIVGITVLIAIRFPGVDHLVHFVPGLNVAQNARLLGGGGAGAGDIVGIWFAGFDRWALGWGGFLRGCGDGAGGWRLGLP